MYFYLFRQGIIQHHKFERDVIAPIHFWYCFNLVYYHKSMFGHLNCRTAESPVGHWTFCFQYFDFKGNKAGSYAQPAATVAAIVFAAVPAAAAAAAVVAAAVTAAAAVAAAAATVAAATIAAAAVAATAVAAAAAVAAAVAAAAAVVAAAGAAVAGVAAARNMCF